MTEDRIMKRIVLYVLSITALCTFVSCQKSEIDSTSGKLAVIRASLPDDSSKAALSGKQLVWTEGDKITVSFTDESTAEFSLTEGAGTANGTFSGTLPDGKTVSGATAKSAGLFSEGRQVYSATEFPYSLVYSGNDLGNIVFDFDNSSYIALTLKGAGTVLVSTVEVNAGSDYVLDCGTGGVALSDAGVPFYIMLTNEDVSAKLKGLVVTTTTGKTMTVSVDKCFSEMIKSGSTTSTKGHVFPSTKVFKEDIFSGGAGTSSYPFKLANAADIKNFVSYSNGNGIPADWSSFNFASASYNVTDNITMGADDVIAPAFTNPAAPFTGTFDGCSKTVTGLVINNTQNIPCGLFSYAGAKSVIKNLKLMNVKVTSNYVEAAAFVGHAEGSTLTALIVDGNANSTITSTANVTPSPANKYGSWGQAYMTVVGGIAGAVYDTDISNCTVAGRPSTKYRLAGGIVAYAGGETNITNCTIGKYSWVKAGDTLCGGIVGASQSTGTISGCKVYGTIESTKDYCGGIVGVMNSGNVTGCTLQGATVKMTNQVRYVGGICGNISGGSPVIDGCVVKSTTITNGNGLEVGFIAGYIDGGVKVTVSNCVVGSKCSMTASQWAGGILGRAALKSALGIVIDKCSSYGSVTVTKGQSENTGGIAGYISKANDQVTDAYAIISNCLFEKGTLTASAASPNLGGIVGYCGVKKNPQNVSQEYIVNCYTKGATLKDTNATAYMSGIAGRSDYGTCIFGCWSDVVKDTRLVGVSGMTFYPIFHWMYEFSFGNSARYLYYDSSFSAPGNCKAGDKAGVTPAEGISDFTSVDFLAKMNAAAAAYNAAPLVAGTEASTWVSAAGGPTLSTAIADPDQ